MSTRTLTGLVLAAMLAVAGCSGSSTATASPAATIAPAPSEAAPSAAAAGSASVTIQGFAFNPATTTVAVGTKVTWTNMDTAGHTVTLDDGSDTSDTIATGATFDHTFSAAGTFTYHCKIHPSMKGTVTVQ